MIKITQIKQNSPVKCLTFQNMKQIYVKLKNSNQLDTCMKQLTQEFKSIQNQKLLLDLETNFLNDQQLLSFTIYLTKYVKDIRYLIWKIQGNFTDDGQASSIGNLIGRLANAYRLEIVINTPYFADTAAISLSKGLTKLKNLHILKILIYGHGGKICKKLTEMGENKIYQSVNTLQNLEILEYQVFSEKDGYFDVDLGPNKFYQNLDLFKNLSKISHTIYPIERPCKLVDQFFQQEANKLISITLKSSIFYSYLDNNPDYDEYDEGGEDLFNPIQVCNLTRQCLHLPYLLEIKFIKTFDFDDENNFSINLVNLFKEFSEQNTQAILQSLCFDFYIKNQMIMNPQQIFIDLNY